MKPNFTEIEQDLRKLCEKHGIYIYADPEDTVFTIVSMTDINEAREYRLVSGHVITEVKS